MGFIDRVTAVLHTPDIENYRKTVGSLLNLGMRWSGGGNDVDVSCWRVYKSKTCIIVSYDKELTYCDTDYVVKNNLEFVCLEKYINPTTYFKNRYDLK